MYFENQFYCYSNLQQLVIFHEKKLSSTSIE